MPLEVQVLDGGSDGDLVAARCYPYRRRSGDIDIYLGGKVPPLALRRLSPAESGAMALVKWIP
jgi:hypothetical protein